MFVAFIHLRYTQANRPRSFKVPGGKFGAWLITIIGIASSIFGIMLAFYPPTQVKKEVGSGIVYDVTIACLVAVVLLVAFVLYQLSKHHNATHNNDWVNPDNKFAPYTWEIEGLKKPQKVQSNIPTDIMAKDQHPMGVQLSIILIQMFMLRFQKIGQKLMLLLKNMQKKCGANSSPIISLRKIK